MTAASLERIQQSYKQLAPHVGEMTRTFYARLFAACPETRELFRQTDMDAQSRHLSAALALVVRNLRVLDALEQPLRELGAGHACAGVRREHYPIVCEVMIEALAETAADAWNAELATDWKALLNRVCRHMIDGAASATPL